MFKLGPQRKIIITAGDSRELDLRILNKDNVWHRPLRELPHFPKIEFPLLNAKGELLLKTIQVQRTDSEGKSLWEEDSEGNLIPVMIPNLVPTYPHDMPMYDSEGNEIYGFFWTPEGLMR